MKQLEGRDIESAELQPINLGVPVLKELGAKWMVEMAEYFGENPQIVVNGFVKAGIARALDGHIDCTPEEENAREDKTESEEYQIATVVCWTLLARMISVGSLTIF